MALLDEQTNDGLNTCILLVSCNYLNFYNAYDKVELYYGKFTQLFRARKRSL